MDEQKPDSQKRSLSQLEDSSLSCPECKDLNEHRRKNCPKQLVILDSSDSMDVDTDKEEPRKRQCYRCDDCFLSFAGSQSLEEHLQKHCLEMSDIEKSVIRDSYESSIDVLIEAMSIEKDNLELLKVAKVEAQDSLRRYKNLKNLKDTAEKAYQEAFAIEQNLGSIVPVEQHENLSHIISETFREYKNAMNALESESQLLHQAVLQVKECNLLFLHAGIKVHYALSHAMRSMNKRRASPFSCFSSSVNHERELNRFRDILKDRHAALDELQEELADLNASVASILGIDRNEERPSTSQNRNGGREVKEENLTLGDAPLSRMDANTGIQDDQRPSTSGTSSVYVSDSSSETADNMM